ncbi:putative minus-end-directed kinesin ATPase [Helianthus annuus]|uniref:Minus-end-directed kinesin ATPase n=1 Tax=Helianthus annuus TaxID=4232 RepID=A0A9K3HBI8_HELAN|nr:putative minus-end-directed kinesin ATPase [Helianthus annuus]KAJ0848248.1 putative minus-end-directed kinesin ATPase [Helianthus annuus]
MHPDGQLNGFNNVNGGGVKHAEITGHILEGDLPAARVPELHNLENASSQSLFHIVHKILDDSIENRKEDVPDRVACLLKKLVQMIEQRCSKQAEDFKKQNNLYKTREEKYQFKMRVFKTLVTGAMEENEVLMNQLHHIKTEKTMVEEKKKLEDVELIRLRKENNDRNLEISQLKQEFEVTRDAYENRCIQLETDAMEIKSELENKIINLENLLTDSRKKVKELEKFTESKFQRWKKKERCYKNFMDFQYGSLKELRMGSESIKQEVLMTQQIYAEEINEFGMKIQGLVDAAQNYHAVLTENRKLYNEVQDLKGNIRVYCRIRPFLKGQSQRQTTIEYIGDNGELVVTNPSQKAKESHRLFKFNKVFSPAATQEEVFIDTQPLIRSVLDGYNVCIFAYGQTGSGKTYTMTGPNVSSPEDWGVNYRALNDLFHLSQVRRNSFEYEIGVQMVEIYNEQVRDLLSSNITQKRYPSILTSSSFDTHTYT